MILKQIRQGHGAEFCCAEQIIFREKFEHERPETALCALFYCDERLVILDKIVDESFI